MLFHVTSVISASCTNFVSKDCHSSVLLFNQSLGDILDHHAPVRTREIVVRQMAKWFSDDMCEVKQNLRRLECLYNKTKLEVHRLMFTEQRNLTRLIVAAKNTYYCDVIDSAGVSKKLFAAANKLFGNDHEVVLPDHSITDELMSKFSEYFVRNILSVKLN